MRAISAMGLRTNTTRGRRTENRLAKKIRLAKEFYGCDPDKQFYVPDGVVEHFKAQLGRRGTAAHEAWNKMFAGYRAQYPDLAEQIVHAATRPSSRLGQYAPDLSR